MKIYSGIYQRGSPGFSPDQVRPYYCNSKAYLVSCVRRFCQRRITSSILSTGYSVSNLFVFYQRRNQDATRSINWTSWKTVIREINNVEQVCPLANYSDASGLTPSSKTSSLTDATSKVGKFNWNIDSQIF